MEINKQRTNRKLYKKDTLTKTHRVVHKKITRNEKRYEINGRISNEMDGWSVCIWCVCVCVGVYICFSEHFASVKGATVARYTVKC